MRQVPRTEPAALGAFINTDRSFCAPGLTALSRTSVDPFMAFPPTKANLKPASHAQEPLFLTRQVLVKAWPWAMAVLSGMVTSWTKVRP